MWEEKTGKIIRWNNNTNFVRSITYSGNAETAFPLNKIQMKNSARSLYPCKQNMKLNNVQYDKIKYGLLW